MALDKFKYGIVFCGGGAKGAYQIGVWKRLRELGIDKEIIGVSGASIGAMNSMLFVQGDYDTAEEVWKQTRSGDMMVLNMPMIQDVLRGLVLSEPQASVVPILSTALFIINPRLFGPGAEKILPELGLFTHERLRAIIRSAVDPLGIATANKQVYTALTVLSGMHLPDQAASDTDSGASFLKPVAKIEYRSWEKLTYDEIVETVLASAALPVIYPPSTHQGETYIDGGVLDNTPVKPLVDAGFSTIIVIHLEHLNLKNRSRKEQRICSQGKEGTCFIHIWPSSPAIGNTPLATLQINAELTETRIRLGYMDAQSQLVPRLEEIKREAQRQMVRKDAETHYKLANEIYKNSIRDAVLKRRTELFRAFLQAEQGQAMLRNYEYAATLGYEPAKEMVAQIHKFWQEGAAKPDTIRNTPLS